MIPIIDDPFQADESIRRRQKEQSPNKNKKEMTQRRWQAIYIWPAVLPQVFTHKIAVDRTIESVDLNERNVFAPKRHSSLPAAPVDGPPVH